MLILIGVLILGLLTLLGKRWMDDQANPNRHLSTSSDARNQPVELLANRYGHYVASGTINGSPVVFLLDTGATHVSIPGRIADQLNLTAGKPRMVETANGVIQVQQVELQAVGLGGLTRYCVSGHINRHSDSDAVLLGMSFLRHFEIHQREGTLRLQMM